MLACPTTFVVWSAKVLLCQPRVGHDGIIVLDAENFVIVVVPPPHSIMDRRTFHYAKITVFAKYGLLAIAFMNSSIVFTKSKHNMEIP